MWIVVWLAVGVVCFRLLLIVLHESRDHENDTPGTPKSRRAVSTEPRGREPAPPAVVVAPLVEIPLTIKLAEASGVFHVPSHSFTNVEGYRCDLDEMSCTCSDFLVHRASLPRDDRWRYCRHLCAVLSARSLVVIEDPDAADLWADSGGRLFAWTAPTGKKFVISVDPMSEWIHVDPVRKQTRGDSPFFGWNAVNGGWARGSHPRGAGPGAIAAALALADAERKRMLGTLGPDIEATWERRQSELEEKWKSEEAARQSAARAQGLLCGVCSAPLGKPWGTPVGTEVVCGRCGFTNLVKGDSEADAAERALIDWKYYDDPRSKGSEGIFTKAKKEHGVEIGQLIAQNLSGGDFAVQRAKIDAAFSERFNALHDQRHAELRGIRRRIADARRKLSSAPDPPAPADGS